MSTLDRDALRELAEAATPGPWHPWNPDADEWPKNVDEIASVNVNGAGVYAPSTDDDNYWTDEQQLADARFIAAANPETVLSLLAAIDAAAEALQDINAHSSDPYAAKRAQRVLALIRGGDTEQEAK